MLKTFGGGFDALLSVEFIEKRSGMIVRSEVMVMVIAKYR